MRIAPVLVIALLFAVACSDSGDDGGAGTAAGAAGNGSGGTTGGASGVTGGSGGMGNTATGGSGGMTGGSGGMTGGSGGMTGGSGGMTGGSGGMNGDSGMPDTGEPDPCEDVANPCTDEGLSCDGTDLLNCEENADGCLVETSEDCTDGDNDYCDDSGATPECAACADVADTCAAASSECDGDTLIVCAANADGCLVETQTDCTAGDNEYCDAGGATAVCVDCADLDDACTVAGTSCGDDTTLVTCAANAEGCLVATETDCTGVGSNNACDADADPDAACAVDVCRDDNGVLKDDVCVDDEASCAGAILVTCEPDLQGCPIATQVDCTMDPGNNFCNPTPAAACDHDPCIGITNCTNEGSVCRGPLIVECAPNLDGCLVENPHDCTVGGTVDETCDPSVTPHVCVPCLDDARCVGAAENDTSCNANTFERCTDTDDDGCMNRLDEPCGDNFSCDAEDGCVYDGGEACAETLDPAHVLRDPMMSYGPFTTMGAANDYSSYGACPGLIAGVPFGAAAPDLLFALDVPPNSVIEVAFDSPTGFTGTGAWMMLLSTCTATAEATCSAISDERLDYANTGNATTRVYIVVDADGASNVGTFGLAVSTRPLDCGDGQHDGDEECDDGNIFDGDGCAPDCTLEDGYACTGLDPSVCTLRPTGPDIVCGNVACDPLEGAPANSVQCCTADAKCGIAYEPFFGSSCIERVEERPTTGAAANMCPDEPLSSLIFLFVAVPLDGCCTADSLCGVHMNGAGCVERTAAWTAMEDGRASVYYNGPFLEDPCTP